MHMQTRDLHILGEYAAMCIQHGQFVQIVIPYLPNGLFDATLDNIPTEFLKCTCN